MNRNVIWSLSLLMVMTVGQVNAQIQKLAPMVHAFAAQQVEAAKRARGQETKKPALFVVRVHPDVDASEVSQQIEATGAEV